MSLIDWLATREPYSPFPTPPGTPSRFPTRPMEPFWPLAVGLLASLIGGLPLYGALFI